MNPNTKILLIRILKTLQIVLGIAIAVASVWGKEVPFNVEDVQKLISTILALLGAVVLVGQGAWRLYKDK